MDPMENIWIKYEPNSFYDCMQIKKKCGVLLAKILFIISAKYLRKRDCMAIHQIDSRVCVVAARTSRE